MSFEEGEGGGFGSFSGTAAFSQRRQIVNRRLIMSARFIGRGGVPAYRVGVCDNEFPTAEKSVVELDHRFERVL